MIIAEIAPKKSMALWVLKKESWEKETGFTGIVTVQRLSSLQILWSIDTMNICHKNLVEVRVLACCECYFLSLRFPICLVMSRAKKGSPEAGIAASSSESWPKLPWLPSFFEHLKFNECSRLKLQALENWMVFGLSELHPRRIFTL